MLENDIIFLDQCCSSPIHTQLEIRHGQLGQVPKKWAEIPMVCANWGYVVRTVTIIVINCIEMQSIVFLSSRYLNAVQLLLSMHTTLYCQIATCTNVVCMNKRYLLLVFPCWALDPIHLSMSHCHFHSCLAKPTTMYFFQSTFRLLVEWKVQFAVCFLLSCHLSSIELPSIFCGKSFCKHNTSIPIVSV